MSSISALPGLSQGSQQPGVGSSAPSQVLVPSTPVTVDAAANPIVHPKSGQQLMISENVSNPTATNMQVITVIMVRDSAGVTSMIGLHFESLGAGQTVGIGMSWIPEESGSYSIKAFSVRGLDIPVLLAPPMESKVMVS